MTGAPADDAAVARWRHEALPGEAGHPALLMLHGTGGDERDMLRLGRALAPGAPLLAPRGRVSEGGMARYFARLPDAPFTFPDLDERIDDLAGFVRAAVARYGLEGRPLVGVGYSNGANAASALLLRHPGLLDGAVVLRGLLPTAPRPGLDLSGAQVLVAPGRGDALVPPAMAQALIDALRTAGAEVTEAWAPGGHGLTDADLQTASAWLTGMTAQAGSGAGGGTGGGTST